MSELRTKREMTRRDRRAYHRLMTGFTWHGRRNLKFLTLTGVCGNEGYRKNFDKLRRVLRKIIGSFPYFAVRTEEGKLGVIHLVYKGAGIDYKSLSKIWMGISQAWNISISSVKGDLSGISLEMTRQMKSARYSWSRDWIPVGLLGHWKQFKGNILEWNKFVQNWTVQIPLEL